MGLLALARQARRISRRKPWPELLLVLACAGDASAQAGPVQERAAPDAARAPDAAAQADASDLPGDSSRVTTGVAAPGKSGGAADVAGLSLGAVLESTRAHHPLVVAALQNEAIARAELMAARGGFDPELDMSTKLRTGGYYELRRFDVELRQPTPLWGSEVYAGYRLGLGVEEGRYPGYYSDETLDGGEVRLGVRVPIWRDGPLDKRRAERARADLSVDAAAEQRFATEVTLQRGATDAYFGWVAAGRGAQVARQLFELARTRRAFVDARVAAGAVAEIESLEAERSLLRRQASVLSAERAVERNALVLALYSRGDSGAPRVPSVDALPDALPLPEPLPGQAGEQDAVECHPALAQKRAKIEQARVGAKLARAQRAPRLDATLETSRDMGSGDVSLPGTVVEGGVVFSMPLLMRAPRGRLEAAEGLVRVLEEELRLLQDELRIARDNARSAERYAWEQYDIATRLLDTVERLAVAERRRFDAGSTSLFVVNQREQALAEAALAQVDAARELWAARAAYRAASTCSTPRP